MTDALTDADGNAVFVRSDGSYSYDFPEENITDTAESDDVKFVVYGFVGEHTDYEEQSWTRDEREDALELATEIYGNENVDKFERDGEVFEVEVHRRER